MMDIASRFKTVTILVVLSCLLQTRMLVSFLDVPYLFVVEFIIKLFVFYLCYCGSISGAPSRSKYVSYLEFCYVYFNVYTSQIHLPQHQCHQ